MGRHFIIIIDHQPLKYHLDKKFTAPSQCTWLVELIVYDYEIEYKLGNVNIVADALSRINSIDATIHAISSVSFDVLDRIKTTW